MDVYPPIEIRQERTRLNLFFEEGKADSHLKFLFGSLMSSDREFGVQGTFRQPEDDRQLSHPTFVLTPRGPVFVFPLLLPPFGRTEITEPVHDLLIQCRDLFFRCVPNRKILRLGLVRDAVFSAGKTDLLGLVGGNASLGGAALAGGVTQLAFADSKCNIGVGVALGQVGSAAQLPVGVVVQESPSNAIHIHIDVNNHEIRPLTEADIDEILERAESLWPGAMLDFVNSRLTQA